jgi:hypothetical protein
MGTRIGHFRTINYEDIANFYEDIANFYVDIANFWRCRPKVKPVYRRFNGISHVWMFSLHESTLKSLTGA